MWWYIWIGSVILWITILISYIEVEGHLMKSAEHQKLQYEVKALLGIIRLKFEVPIMKFKGLQEGFELEAEVDVENMKEDAADVKEMVTAKKMLHFYQDIKRLRNHVYEFSEWMSGALSNIICTQFRWSTKIGLGEAPSTAVITGMIWGLKSSLIGYLSKRINLVETPELHVIPQYNMTNLATDLNFKMKVRHFYTFLAFWLLIFRIIRVKGGIKVWTKTLYSFYLNIRDNKKKKLA